MKNLYFLVVHYGMCFIVMFGFDVMQWFRTLSNNPILYSFLSVPFLAVIFTLPIVVIGTTKKQ